MAKITELERWWTPSQVQGYTGYSRQGVLDFAREGRIRAAFVGKAHKEYGRGMYVYDPESVEEFVKKHGFGKSAKKEGRVNAESVPKSKPER